MKKLFSSPGWKRFGVTIIIFLIAIIALIACAAVTAITDLSQKTVDISAETETNEAIKDAEEYNDVMKEVTGVNSGRKSFDDRTVTDIFKTATTWTDEESYTEQYNKLLEKYPYLSTDDRFLSIFFPSPDDMTAMSQIQGYNMLETGTNSTFVSLTSNVTSVTGDVYSYITDITMQSNGLVGGTADGHVIVTYDTDPDGKVLNIQTFNVS